MKKTLQILVAAMVLGAVSMCAIADVTPADRLAVAGNLELDYHAELMVARDTNDYAVNWNSCGRFMGCLGDFGFDGPRDLYPKYVSDLDGTPAVVFDGNDRYRHFPDPTPTSICDGTFSVEVWTKDIEGTSGKLIEWGGFSVDPAAFGAGGEKWQHLAVVADKGKTTLYRDGTEVGKSTVPEMSPSQIIVGTKLKGAIAGLRVHNEALTAEQLQHNVKGGVMLGTKLFVNFDTNTPNDVFFGDPDLPQFKTRYSKHFRSTWEHEKDENDVMKDRIDTQLEQAEHHYYTYEQLGYHLPVVSANADLRGDGKKYLIPNGNDWGLEGGGGWMGWSGRGFGFSIAGPGRFSGHELGHGTQGHQLNPMEGNFWEVHTSWLPGMAYPLEEEPVGVFMSSAHLFPGHGRNYYHTWQIFDHLTDTPEYGPLFITKMWNARSDLKGERKYPWLTGELIDPDPSTPFRDECVKMARKFVTWDFSKRDAYLKGAEKVDLNLYRTVLEPIEYQPGWYRVPRAYAPLQWGFNICPLTIEGDTVTADLQGYVNLERGSHWSASFVAVQADGSPRYSKVWNEGEMDFPVKEDDKELYLVVAATPTKIAPLGTTGDYRSDDWHQFPYRVKLTGAVPREVLKRERPEEKDHNILIDIWRWLIWADSDTAGSAHANGGGFVADTAHVDASAFVGPDAQVLVNGRVLDNARITGYAVVRGTVKDNAIVSDFALVESNTTVRGNAKIRNRAIVTGGCDISGNAKVIEHSVVTGPISVSGNAVVKGSASVYGGRVNGTAILDGHYAKANDVSRGNWFTWSWSTGKNAGEGLGEFGGIYCQYTFEKEHPYLAWDTHGVIWGYLVGDPKVDKQTVHGEDSNVLVLNGKDQFVELPVDAGDMSDLTISMDVKWAGNQDATLIEFAGNNEDSVRLMPSDEQGTLAFRIRAGDVEQVVRAPAALPHGRWVNVQVMLGENLATLLIDNKEVARNDSFTLNPDDIRANVGYIGRGTDGGYFKGAIDNFTLYGLALKDFVAPTPNPSEWLLPPTMAGPGMVVMHAVPASDPRGFVEYQFRETSGAQGAKSSEWQSNSFFVATGLQTGNEYTYEVVTRDGNGNVSQPAPGISVKWHNPGLFCQNEDEAGVVVFEAEHYNNKIDGPAPQAWVLDTKAENAGGEGAMVGLPDTGVQNRAFTGPRMDYHVKLNKPGEYWLWLRASGPHWRGDSVNIAFDYQVNEKAPFIDMGVGKFRWVRYAHPFKVTEPGTHTVTIWMREDGTMLDKMLLTSKGDYTPSEELDAFKAPVGIGPEESRKVQ